jgi:apolipoprotein N-acyltransferase
MIVLVMGIGGFMRLTTHKDAASGEMVRVVQPNIQSAHKWDAQKRWEFLQETLAVGLAGDASSTTPKTVIMPETAVAFYLDEEEDVRQALTERIAARLPSDGGLVTGTVRREVDMTTFAEHYYNTLAVMDTKGILRGWYDKRLLVPFGEYIPGRSWLERLPLPVAIRTISQSRIDFTHGTRSPVLPTPAGLAVGLICYEGIFPLQVAEAAQEARYLINVTNDGWFTGTIALYQHAALTRLRAVETGLPMVRVANTGITIVYDGYGRVLAKLPINTPAYADVALPQPLNETPLVRLIGFFR